MDINRRASERHEIWNMKFETNFVLWEFPQAPKYQAASHAKLCPKISQIFVNLGLGFGFGFGFVASQQVWETWHVFRKQFDHKTHAKKPGNVIAQ